MLTPMGRFGCMGYAAGMRCAAAWFVLACAAAGQAVGAPAKKENPKAGLIVPESVKKARQGRPEDDPSLHYGLGAPEVLAAAGPPRLEVGAWVEYAVRQQGGPSSRVRLSVLPPPKDAPEDRRWLEVATVGDAVFPAVVKLLVHGDPLQKQSVERLVLYPAGQVPLELPLDEGREALEADQPKVAVAKVTKLGAADVVVPAGTFHAQRLKIAAKGGATRLWLDPAVPLWGLVRSEGAGRTVELLQYGATGAHTVVPPAPGEPDERPDAGN